MREDFRTLLDLLEFGPPAEFPSLPIEQADELKPRLVEAGLDIVSDTRITDLREWFDDNGESPRRVFVYRHVLVRKTTESESSPGLRLQSLWDSPDLAVYCENGHLSPVLRRWNQPSTGDPAGPFSWEVALDFSSVPVGETVQVMVGIMQTVQPDDHLQASKQWWHFEIDAQPEVATSWILLPDDQPHDNFQVVRFRGESSDVIELVQPTHQTRMQGGAVMNWSVVHPEPGYTYSSRWGAE